MISAYKLLYFRFWVTIQSRSQGCRPREEHLLGPSKNLPILIVARMELLPLKRFSLSPPDLVSPPKHQLERDFSTLPEQVSATIKVHKNKSAFYFYALFHT